MVFNVSYGLQGQARYTHVPSILEMVGIPYVASGPMGHSLSLDKVVEVAAPKGGKALYMHCLPADISGVSCERGEVAASVFERYRTATYREAEHKPYVMAAMILLNRFEHPDRVLFKLRSCETPRRFLD